MSASREDEWDAPADSVACPTCEGSGQTSPEDGRPCAMCAGSGRVTADAAADIARSEEVEAGPTADE